MIPGEGADRHVQLGADGRFGTQNLGQCGGLINDVILELDQEIPRNPVVGFYLQQ